MSYYETYLRRVSHLGKNKQEIALNSGKIEFQHYLNGSENSVFHLNSNRAKDFGAVILTNKQDENKVTLMMMVALDYDVRPGDIVEWGDEHWIVYQQQSRAYEPYHVYYIVRCNYLLKWIDENKVIQTEWCHLVSSLDSKVKENFRTWNSMITPQPNKYMEIMLPRREIKKYTDFIIDDEKWYMVEKDTTSVPGVLYMSCTEQKINEHNDDLEQDLANVNTLSKWEIEVPDLVVQVGQVINPTIVIYKDGTPQSEATFEMSILEGPLEFNENGEIVAAEEGEGQIEVVCIDNNGLEHKTQFKVTVSTEEKVAYLISGADKIRVSRQEVYSIIPESGNVESFFLDSDLASVIKLDDYSYSITGNSNNKIGKTIFSVTIDGEIFTKEIEIISLWK